MTTQHTVWQNQPAARRVARTPSEIARCVRERDMLIRFGGTCAPDFLHFDQTSDHAVLYRNWITGPTLSECPTDQHNNHIQRLYPLLRHLHDQGWVHSDIHPSNIICSVKGPVLIDWEHAAPIGVDITSLPNRAIRPGHTHPDVIWSRGKVYPTHDLHTLARLADT